MRSVFAVGFLLAAVVSRTDAADREGVSTKTAEVKVVEMLRKQDAVLTEFWSKPERNPEKIEAAIMGLGEKMKGIGEEARKGD